MSNQPAATTIEAMMPSCLDDVIRKNRDKARLYLATPELKADKARVIGLAEPRDTISNYRFIVFQTTAGKPNVILLGHGERARGAWITSAVEGIDFGTGMVATANSLYRLEGAEGEGEPPFEHLAIVCAAMHSWGNGKVLGVPEWFF